MVREQLRDVCELPLPAAGPTAEQQQRVHPMQLLRTGHPRGQSGHRDGGRVRGQQ